jgi:hypothetical protein
MSKSKKVFNSLILSSAIAVLSACGGGGGGNGGGSTSVVAASAPVTVTAANAPDVAGSTFDATDDLSGGGGGVAGVFAASAGGTQSADINVLDAMVAQIRRAPDLSGSSASGVGPAAIVQINSEPCDSGTFSGSFNDADNDQGLSTGDSLSITSNNCSFDGVVMNGSLTVDNVVVTGGFINDIAPYSFSFRIRTSNYSVTAEGETVTMDGDITLQESTDDNVTFRTTFSGDGIEIVTGGDTLILTDFSIDEIENEASGAYTLSINGTISSSSIGGSVIVTTNIAFTGVGASEPTGGEARCVGANGTSVRLIANADGNTVQLQVDTNGDGTADNTIDETWVNL